MSGAVTDYAECRDHIIGFYKDMGELLGEVEDDLDDAYDYLQDFLREGVKPDATDGVFWAAFALALHAIPGGGAFDSVSKTLNVIKDAQPVFAKLPQMKGRLAGPGGESSGLIEEQKRRLESRLKAVAGLVDVAEITEQQGVVRRRMPRGREVRKAIAHLDNEVARLDRYHIRGRLLPKIQADIGPRLPRNWKLRVDQLHLDYLFAEMFIIEYVRKAVVAKGLWRAEWLDGINDHQEQYIYRRATHFRSRVANLDQLIERWGIAKEISRGMQVQPLLTKATKSIPFAKWPGT